MVDGVFQPEELSLFRDILTKQLATCHPKCVRRSIKPGLLNKY